MKPTAWFWSFDLYQYLPSLSRSPCFDLRKRFRDEASASAYQQCDNALLCALEVKRGRTIQTERSHTMQNGPEVVQQGISIDG